MVTVKGGRVQLRQDGDLESGPAGGLFVGVLDGRHWWAVDANDDGDLERAGIDEAELIDLMRLYGSVDEASWAAAGRAVQLVDWARNNRFCGHCGAATGESPGERARRCPACGLLAFPRLAPAVIVLVEREDGRALLARNARWPTNMYSCLAGFVEPGETVEAAVRREVHEEVGIGIGDLRYFGSQPWPFPHSLMLGFHARYLDGEVTCDQDEIAEARWYSVDDLPAMPGRISIARRLIDDWMARQP